MLEKLQQIEDDRKRIKLGGGVEAIERQHQLGKLTARERIEKLVDPGTFKEVEAWVTATYKDFGATEQAPPADGVITGYAEVNSRPIYLWAQDATTLGGTVATQHAKKITVMQDRALRARIPIIAMIDSEGIRAEDAIDSLSVFWFPIMAYFLTQSSGVIPQICLIMGPCVGELALLTALHDFVFMVRNTSYMHVAPPPQGVSAEELGGTRFHSRFSGCCDLVAENDAECIEKAKELLGFLPQNNTENAPVVDTGDDPNRRDEELLDIVPVNPSKPYDMHNVIRHIVDNGNYFEIKRSFATNKTIGFARLDGRVVAIIGNNPISKGGCEDIDSTDKQVRFTRFCDNFHIPHIFLADTPAYVAQKDEELRGIIRHGSRTLYANTEASVPRPTITLRKSYGGGQLAMNPPALGCDLAVAWPTLERALMGARSAISIIYKRQMEAADDPEAVYERAVPDFSQRIKRITRQAVDEFIDPRDTRPYLIQALRMLSNKKWDFEPRKHGNLPL